MRCHRACAAAAGGVLALLALPTGAGPPEGRAIVERDCVACHDVAGPAAETFDALLRRKAPDLFYAGSKFQRAWLVEWLQQPTPIRRMGAVYLNHLAVANGKDRIATQSVQPCPANLGREQAEAVADYLLALTGPAMRRGVVDPGKKFSKRKALRLFRKQLPCIGCHTIRWGKRVLGGVSGPDLSDAGRRLDPDWVYARIENPQHWDPKTWMPRLRMSHRKRELLALFIASMAAPGGARAPPPGATSAGAPAPLAEFVAPPGSGGSRAEANYRLYCVQCHGSQGNGQGVNDTAGGLSVSPRSHVSATEMAQLSDRDVRLAIAQGGDAVEKSGLMPPWGATLSAPEIDGLVRYLRMLCQCVAQPPR